MPQLANGSGHCFRGTRSDSSLRSLPLVFLDFYVRLWSPAAAVASSADSGGLGEEAKIECLRRGGLAGDDGGGLLRLVLCFAHPYHARF